jgi:aspartate kinase
MKVLKFGGGIIINPDAAERMAAIIKDHSDDDLVIVVSALNKMTNAFEELVHAYVNSPETTDEKLKTIRDYHYDFAERLFSDRDHEIFRDLHRMFTDLETYLGTPSASFYNFEYDQIVSYGEQLSSAIISHALVKFGVEHRLFDARDLIRADANCSP